MTCVRFDRFIYEVGNNSRESSAVIYTYEQILCDGSAAKYKKQLSGGITVYRR